MIKTAIKKILLLIAIIGLPLIITSCGEQTVSKATVGNPAPDFTLVDMSGRNWTLYEMKGKVVFINFWATWCPPCREEMPSMQNLYEKLPQDKFTMLAILNRDSPALAELFAKNFGLTMPILDDQDNQVGSRYGLTGVPETYIVDKQGILREKFIGPAKWDSPESIQMLMKYIEE